MSTAIMGIGNLLLQDEGVGVHVITRLREDFVFPESVRLIDGGTMGLDLLPFLEDNEQVIIVDAVNLGKPPGSVEVIEGDSLPSFLNTKFSVHQIGLPDMLFAARLTGKIPPKLCLVGIQPKSLDTGVELSAEIRMKLDLVVNTVLERLRSWGIEPRPRPPR